MTKGEKIAIMRLLSDMIRSDATMDRREILHLRSIKEKLNIQKEEQDKAYSLTMSEALLRLQRSSQNTISELLAMMKGLALSDNYFSRKEALIYHTLVLLFTSEESNGIHIISLEQNAGFLVDDMQVLYIENEYDIKLNRVIQERYERIISEFRLMGFDFLYIPKIVDAYKQFGDKDLTSILSFLYPGFTEERISLAIHQISALPSSGFWKHLYLDRIQGKIAQEIEPSLLLKINESNVNNQLYANYLILPLDKKFLPSLSFFSDGFSSLYRMQILDLPRIEKNSFIYSSFHKQLWDMHLLQKKVKSTILIDFFKGEILFPEASLRIEKLHRREKALYVLFLLESSKGGINFEALSNLDESFQKEIQKKYALIYEKFGGEKKNAPNLFISENRLPMISLIKRQILKLKEGLYHAGDYVVKRNKNGAYSCHVRLEDLNFRAIEGIKPQPIVASQFFEKLL